MSSWSKEEYIESLNRLSSKEIPPAIANDIRSMAGVILGCASVVLSDIKEDDSDTDYISQELQGIRDASNRILNILDAYVEHSRL